MTYTIRLSQKDTNATESPLISIVDPENDELLCHVSINFSKLISGDNLPSETAMDLLLIASTVYTLDREIQRRAALDRWTRNFIVKVPVSSANSWSKAANSLSECLNFLSGDKWKFSFENRSIPLYSPKPKRRKKNNPVPVQPTPEAVSLFSGGVDSFVGCIDWLHEHPQKTIALVGHHDPTISGVQKSQENVLKAINDHYGLRVAPYLSGIGPSRIKSQLSKDHETTTRSRSFLFLAMGILVADVIGEHIPLFIPENGTIALNVPLTPSRRGACSTRTAHPYYLELFQTVLTKVSLSRHEIKNPLIEKTKGEVVAACKNQSLVKNTLDQTVSCAKSGHVVHWINRSAHGCGACMPCIYRRAALHKSGLDTEIYGYDICSGDIDPENRDSEAADDLRACLFFLSRNYSIDAIARQLWGNGNLSLHQSRLHAATVSRAMNEIRNLFQDKGTQKIKQLAKLGKNAY